MPPWRQHGAAASPLANINADTIRRAEEAVSKLSDQYRDWVRGDVEKLRACLSAAEAGGDARDGAYKTIRQVAHDLRGQGTTFGYPLITRIAQSISQVFKEQAGIADADDIFRAHIDAVSEVIETNASDANSAQAAEIIKTLETSIGRPVD